MIRNTIDLRKTFDLSFLETQPQLDSNLELCENETRKRKYIPRKLAFVEVLVK